MNAIIRRMKSVRLLTQNSPVLQPHRTAGYSGNIYARNVHAGTSNTDAGIEPPNIPNKSETLGKREEWQRDDDDSTDIKVPVGGDGEVDDSQIQPEWLAMERRVANHKPKRKG